jgi:hypothetical protein
MYWAIGGAVWEVMVIAGVARRRSVVRKLRPRFSFTRTIPYPSTSLLHRCCLSCDSDPSTAPISCSSLTVDSGILLRPTESFYPSTSDIDTHERSRTPGILKKFVLRG